MLRETVETERKLITLLVTALINLKNDAIDIQLLGLDFWIDIASFFHSVFFRSELESIIIQPFVSGCYLESSRSIYIGKYTIRP